MHRRLIMLVLLGMMTACGDSGKQPLPPISTVVPATVAPAAATTAPSSGGTRAFGLEPVAEGFSEPVFLTHAGDDSGRLYVVEQAGTIRTLDGTLFLDVRERVNDSGNEQGLLGLAFAPDFATSGVFYLNYTATNDDSITARYRLAADGESGDPGSEEILLRIADPAANHNGGMLAFGPDGLLYIGLGDGGAANDRYQNGQNRNSLWGKLLRLDVSASSGYTIPPGNPFGNGETKPEIWAYGLRNPWRFSFDRATGDLFVGDVGQNRVEWLHVQAANAGGGQNYGWPIVEGFACLSGNSCDKTGLTQPVAEYSHAEGGCSVVGGYVYRGTRLPNLVGTYLFGDYCSGKIWTMQADGDRWNTTEALDTELLISSFGEDQAGEVYVVAHNTGAIYRVVQ